MSGQANPPNDMASKAQVISQKIAADPKRQFSLCKAGCRKCFQSCGCCKDVNPTPTQRREEFENETNNALSLINKTIKEQAKADSNADEAIGYQDFPLLDLTFGSSDAKGNPKVENSYTFIMDTDFGQPNTRLSISPQRDIVALWTPSSLYLYNIYESKIVKMAVPNFHDTSNICRYQRINMSKYGIVFTPKEDSIIVNHTAGMSFFKIDEKRRYDKEYQSVKITDITESSQINHFFFLDDETTAFGTPSDDYVNITPDLIYLNYSSKNNESKTLTSSILLDISSQTIAMNGTPEIKTIPHADEFENFENSTLLLWHVSAALYGAYRVEVIEDKINISFYQETMESIKDQRKLIRTFTKTHHRVPVKQDLFTEEVPSDKGILLASDPVGKLIHLSFNISKDCEITNIIDLPPKVRTINCMTHDENFNFILINCGEGEMYVWAKLRDKSYGIIYYCTLEASITKLFLTPSLNYILQITKDKLKVLNFNPYDQQYKERERCEEEQRAPHDEGLPSIPLAEGFILNVKQDMLSLYDSITNETTNKSFPSGLRLFEYHSSWFDSTTTDKWHALCYLVPVGDKSHIVENVEFVVYQFDLGDGYDTGERTPSIDMILQTRIRPGNYGPIVNLDAVHIYETGEKITLYQIEDASTTYNSLKKIEAVYKNRSCEKVSREAIYSGSYLVFWNPQNPDAEGRAESSSTRGRAGDGLSPPDHGDFFDNDEMENLNRGKPSFMTLKPRTVKDAEDAVVSVVEDNENDLNDSFTNGMDMDSGPGNQDFLEDDSNRRKVVEKSKAYVASTQQPNDEFYEFDIATGMSCLVVSRTSRFIIFIGPGGYELLVNENHGKLIKSADGKTFIPQKPKYIKIRRRIREGYALSSKEQAVFSPDERYLAIAFPVMGKTIYLDLKDPKRIVSNNLTNYPNIGRLQMIFKFIDLKPTNTNKNIMESDESDIGDKKTGFKTMYIAVADYSTSLDSNVIKVYDIATGVFLNGGEYEINYIPLSIEFNRTESQTSLQSITTSLARGSDLEQKKHSRIIRTVTANLEAAEDIPFASILKSNFIKYFEAQSQKSSQAEQFYLECIINILKCIKEEQIMADIRVPYMLYVLDKPGLLQSVFDGRVDLNMLFGLHRILLLAFTKGLPMRTNSLNSISVMFDNYVKAKKYPKIDEICINQVLLEDNPVLKSSMDSRSILSHVIFSNCHTVITGLVEDRYKSVTTLKVEEGKQATLSITSIQGNVSHLMVKKPKKSNEYQIYRSRVKLNLQNGSLSSLGLFKAIELMSDDEIRYKYKQLIYYKWKLVYWFSLAYTLTYFLLNALAYVYFGFQTTLPAGIAIILLNILFILYDFKCFGSEWRQFLKDFNNIIDLLVHSLSIISVIILQIGLINGLHPYFRLAAISAISIRGITLLRMFGALRMFVFLIGQIIVDLAWVPLVLITVLILAGTIYKVAPLPGGNLNSDLTFLQAMQQAFFLVFMPSQADQATISDRTDPAAIIRSIIVVLGGTIIAQGIFNFIIAIFLQTFRKVNADKEIYEIRSLILEIRYIDLFLRGFDKCTREENHYYLFLVPVPKDGKLVENQTIFDNANLVIDNVVGEIAKQGLKKIEGKAKELLPEHQKEIGAVTDAVIGTGKETDKRVKDIMDMAGKIIKGEPPSLEECGQMIDKVKELMATGEKETVERAKNAMVSAEKEGKNLEQGDDVNVKELLEFIASIVELSGPEYRSYAQKIKNLDKIVESFKKCAKLVEQGNLNIFQDLMPEVGDCVKIFCSQKVGDSIKYTGEFVSGMIVEGEQIIKGEKVDFNAVADKVVSYGKNLTGTQFTISDTSKGVLTFVSGAAKDIIEDVKGGEVKIDTIFHIAKQFCSIYCPQESKEFSVKALDILRYLIENWTEIKGKLNSIKASDMTLITAENNVLPELIKISTEVLKLTGKKEYIAKLQDFLPILYAFEEGINFYYKNPNSGFTHFSSTNYDRDQQYIKYFKIIPHFRPLMVNVLKLNSEVFDCVACSIQLLEQSIWFSAGLSQVDLPAFVKCLKTIIIISTKNKSLEEPFGKLEKGCIIIQNALSSDSIDEMVACKTGLELISIFEPSYKQKGERVSTLIGAILRQVRALALKEDLNIEKFITDAALLLEESLEESHQKMIHTIKRVCNLLLASAPTLRQEDSISVKEYCKVAAEIIAICEPRAQKYSDIAYEVVSLIEQTATQRKGASADMYIKLASKILLNFNPAKKESFKVALELAQKIQKDLMQNSIFTFDNFDTKMELLLSMLEAYCSEIGEKKQVVLDSIKAVKTFLSSNQSMKDKNFGEIITMTGQILKSLLNNHFEETEVDKIVGVALKINESYVLLSKNTGKQANTKVIFEIFLQNGFKVLKMFNNGPFEQHEARLKKILTGALDLVLTVEKGELKNLNIYITSAKLVIDSIDPTISEYTSRFVKAAELVNEKIKLAQDGNITSILDYFDIIKECNEIFNPKMNTYVDAVFETVIQTAGALDDLNENLKKAKNQTGGQGEQIILLSLVKLAKPVVLAVQPSFSEPYEVIEQLITAIFKSGFEDLQKLYYNPKFNQAYFIEGFNNLVKQISQIKGYSKVSTAIPLINYIFEKIVTFIGNYENIARSKTNLDSTSISLNLSELLILFGNIVENFYPRAKSGLDACTEIVLKAERVANSLDYEVLEDPELLVKELLKSISKLKPDYAKFSLKIIEKLELITEVLNSQKEPVTGLPYSLLNKLSIDEETISTVTKTLENFDKLMALVKEDNTTPSKYTQILQELVSILIPAYKDIMTKIHNGLLILEAKEGKSLTVGEVIDCTIAVGKIVDPEWRIDEVKIKEFINSASKMMDTALNFKTSVEGEFEDDKKKELAIVALLESNLEQISAPVVQLLELFSPRTALLNRILVPFLLQFRSILKNQCNRGLYSGISTPSDLRPMISVVYPPAVQYLPLADQLHSILGKIQSGYSDYISVLNLLKEIIEIDPENNIVPQRILKILRTLREPTQYVQLADYRIEKAVFECLQELCLALNSRVFSAEAATNLKNSFNNLELMSNRIKDKAPIHISYSGRPKGPLML
jgi:hypothetical protein